MQPDVPWEGRAVAGGNPDERKLADVAHSQPKQTCVCVGPTKLRLGRWLGAAV